MVAEEHLAQVGGQSPLRSRCHCLEAGRVTSSRPCCRSCHRQRHPRPLLPSTDKASIMGPGGKGPGGDRCPQGSPHAGRG